jgi:hypothetical protein
MPGQSNVLGLPEVSSANPGTEARVNPGQKTHGTDESLACWRQGVTIAPATPHAQRHAIHAYFNVCPESPDGRWLLYYTSTVASAEVGDIRVLDRSTGEETIVAADVRTEDAHRAAMQHWINDGRTIVYHQEIAGRFRVIAVDWPSGRSRVIAEDRQLGFGSAYAPVAPIYGCHWQPREHRDLQLFDVNTGELSTAVAVTQVISTYPQWAQQRFESTDLSIFFPVMSTRGERVMFKIARPGGGDDYRGMKVSERDGLVLFDLNERRFLRLIERWGHPSWSPKADAILEHGLKLISIETGQFVKLCPSSTANHQTISPDGKLFLTDSHVGKIGIGNPGDWAVIVGRVDADEFVHIDRFDNEGGATSWRRVHPHPVFSHDGERVYYNVSSGAWSTLFVASAADRR